MVSIEKEVSDEIRDKAKVIAEATGRSVQSVIDDLMDDGIVNLSNEEKKDASLVEQLKEAAELIATVQSINQQVTKNTVLNGGNNKTEVAVETTLEGDIIDRAIDSVQRKADNIKKLAVTLVPVFLLLTGGSMEAIGITNFFGSEDSDDDYDPDYYVEYGGCMNPDADNYDEFASWDDGSCYFDNSGGGGGPPDCNPDWWWQNEAIFDHDHNGQGYNNDLRVQVDFRDLNSCNIHMNNGWFEIMVGDDSRILEYNFHNEFTINEHYLDLAPGDYYVTVDYHTYDGSHWGGPEAWVTMESEPESVQGCTDSSATNYDDKATEDDGSCEYPPECAANIDNLEINQYGTAVEVIFYINQDEGSSCENFDIEVVLIPVDDNTNDDISHEHGISGTSNYFSHTFDDVPVGDWQVEAVLMSNGEELETELSSWIFVEEPETCEINLFDIAFGTNDTHATVAYDLDCGYGAEPGGYNVSVQFMVIGNESYEIGYQYNTTVHYISGYVEDIHMLTLSGFTHENLTHYDFSWFAIWVDEDNNTNYIERYWNNLPFEHPDEPEPCDNLVLTSNSLTLSNQSNNLYLEWELNHDGPDNQDCYVEVEVMVTLYLNGTYHSVNDFKDNGIHRIYATQKLWLDRDDVAGFSEVPEGTWEILIKYRIVGESNASQDYFANSVTIE